MATNILDYFRSSHEYITYTPHDNECVYRVDGHFTGEIMSKVEFRSLLKCFMSLGYVPKKTCGLDGSFALQKRGLYRWLLSKHDIPSFAMVRSVTVFPPNHLGVGSPLSYSIDFISVIGNLK